MHVCVFRHRIFRIEFSTQTGARTQELTVAKHTAGATQFLRDEWNHTTDLAGLHLHVRRYKPCETRSCRSRADPEVTTDTPEDWLEATFTARGLPLSSPVAETSNATAESDENLSVCAVAVVESSCTAASATSDCIIVNYNTVAIDVENSLPGAWEYVTAWMNRSNLYCVLYAGFTCRQ